MKSPIEITKETVMDGVHALINSHKKQPSNVFYHRITVVLAILSYVIGAIFVWLWLKK